MTVGETYRYQVRMEYECCLSSKLFDDYGAAMKHAEQLVAFNKGNQTQGRVYVSLEEIKLIRQWVIEG